jgi:hypothetical protein
MTRPEILHDGGAGARTPAARAAPARRGGLAALLLAVVLLTAVGLSACSAASPRSSTLTYRAHGVSFNHPAGWREQVGYTTTRGGGAKLWGIAVGSGTPHDLIVVQAYRVSPAVTAQNIDAFASDAESFFRHSGLAMQGTPQKITMGGLPGLRFRVTGTVDGTRYASTVVFAFNGTTEYFVNCQSTAGMSAQVGRACDQVTGSFHLGGPVSGATAPAASPLTPGAARSAGATPGSVAGGIPGNGGLGAK